MPIYSDGFEIHHDDSFQINECQEDACCEDGFDCPECDADVKRDDNQWTYMELTMTGNPQDGLCDDCATMHSSISTFRMCPSLGDPCIWVGYITPTGNGNCMDPFRQPGELGFIVQTIAIQTTIIDDGGGLGHWEVKIIKTLGGQSPPTNIDAIWESGSVMLPTTCDQFSESVSLVQNDGVVCNYNVPGVSVLQLEGTRDGNCAPV